LLAGSLILAAAILIAGGFYQSVSAAGRQTGKAEDFKSPEEAVQGIYGGSQGADEKELSALFGPGAKELFSSGVAGRPCRERPLYQAYEKMNRQKVRPTMRWCSNVGEEDCLSRFPL